MALAFFDQDPENDDYYDASSTGILKKSASRLIGLGLAVLAIALYFVFATYSVDDPSMLNVSDRAPENALGFLGAYLADPLYRVLGQAVWVMPLVAGIWAFRFFFDFGAERGSTRSIFTPIALICTAAFVSTGIPDYTWPFARGLGGEFGDMILGNVIRITPLPNGLSLFIWTILFGFLSFASIAYVSGATLLGIARRVDRIILDTRQFALLMVGATATLFGRASKSVSDIRETRRAQKEMVNDSNDGDMPNDGLSHSLRAKFGGITSGLGSTFSAKLRREPTISDEPHVEIDSEALNLAVSNAQQFQPTGDPVKDAINSVVARRAGEHRQKLGEYDINIGKGVPVGDENVPSLGGLNAEQDAVTPKESLVQATVKKIAESKRAKAEKEPELAFEPSQPSYETPPLMLLQNPAQIERRQPSQDALEANARLLESVLDDYGVKGEIIAVRPGPVVTLYELEPAAGLKASRVIGLADDIARSMSALTARVSTIPGRSVIGIELPNEHREMVLLREIFGAKAYGDTKSPLPLALGKDIGGEPIVANLAKMPHLLIAGTTGSGKSVAINTMILSLLYQLKPEECRLIMIDPKMLELSVYDGIPHLLSPVVTDPKKAVVALKWVVQEMEERYRKMSKMGVRNIDGYNARVKDALAKGEGFERVVQTGFDDATGEPVFETESYSPETMPYIVVIVDEMADLMMVAGKEIEACIQRLAQMARASGIHLIMATQRPSVDVITGTIKANFPTRISFQVTSKIDSRTILGEMGAEQLLGQGDMLYMAGGGRITRVHAPFVSDEEVEEVVQHLKLQGEPEYLSSVIEGPEDDKAAADIDAVLGLSNGNSDDELYDQAVMIVARDRKASTSYIQRKLSIGYNKAAKIIERMEEENVVSEANHVGKRDVLVPEI